MAKWAVPRDKIRPTEGRRVRGGSLRFANYLVDWVSILSSEIAVSQLPFPPVCLWLENPQNAEASPRFSSAQRAVPSLRSEKAVEWLRAPGLCSQTSAVWSDAPGLCSEEAAACLVRCTCEISPIGPSSCSKGRRTHHSAPPYFACGPSVSRSSSPPGCRYGWPSRCSKDLRNRPPGRRHSLPQVRRRVRCLAPCPAGR